MQMIGNQLAGGNAPESSQSGGGNAQANVHQSQVSTTIIATHSRNS